MAPFSFTVGGKNYEPVDVENIWKTFWFGYGTSCFFFRISSWTPKVCRKKMLQVRGSPRADKIEQGTKPSPGPFAKTLNIEESPWLAAKCNQMISTSLPAKIKITNSFKKTKMIKTNHRLEMSLLTRTKLLCVASTMHEKCWQQSVATCDIFVSATQ